MLLLRKRPLKRSEKLDVAVDGGVEDDDEADTVGGEMFEEGGGRAEAAVAFTLSRFDLKLVRKAKSTETNIK